MTSARGEDARSVIVGSSVHNQRIERHNNNNNNNELYLHGYNNTALQKRRKHHNYNNLTIRVQFQL